MSAADTQASLVGCGAINPGTLGIVAGSTMPLQLIIDRPTIDPKENLWTGAFIDNLWVLESNVGAAGDIHEWFIDLIMKPLGVSNAYNKFEQLVLSQPAGSKGVLADLGPQIFSVHNMLNFPTAGGFHFTPIAYSFNGTIDIASFARALIENLAYAVRANFEQIHNIENSKGELLLMGGLSRSQVFNQIVSNVLNTEIKVFQSEGALLAGAMASMIGLKKFQNVNEAIQLIEEPIIYYPQEDQTRDYESLYNEWNEFYIQNRSEGV